MKKKLIFFLVVFSAFIASNIFCNSAYQDYVCIQEGETKECVISFLEGPQGKFILKQYKDHSPDEQFLLVLDALACFIAEDVNISINKVVIIPSGTFIAGKKWVNLPATLHSMAGGVSIDKECPFQDIDIHQRFPKPSNSFWYNDGKLSPHQKGLTFNVIKNMARHHDLPLITALDTFVGNADRSAPNLFYDSTTDRFCGIDMAASFSSPLASQAISQIKFFAKIGLSEDQKGALRSYGDTLKVLIERWPVEKQIDKLLIFAQNAGFYEGSALYNQDIIDRLNFHSKCIRNNYENSIELEKLIYKLIEN